MTIQFVAVDNVKKISESTNYSNCKFSFAYENYLSFFILFIQSEEKDILQDYNSFNFFSYDFISTNYNDNISWV